MGRNRKSGGGDDCVSSDKEETLIGGGREEDEDETKGVFFACYLLNSLSPRFKGHTYIGFTVNPKRRIKQHNGELRSGAFRTKSKRPWEMALCIYGFPTNIAALQFEWAWQHPTESLAVRKAAANFKSLSGIANKVKLAFTMLTLPAWQSLNLTVNFFSTKYQKHCAGCPSLPEHMSIQVQSVDELPCYTGNENNVSREMEFGIEEGDGLAEHGNNEYFTAGYRGNKETFEYINTPNYLDCINRTEQTTSALSIGESDFIQPRRELEGYNHYSQPSQTTISPEEVVSLSHVAEASQTSVIPLQEACSVELVPPPHSDLLFRTTPGKDKAVIKNSTILSDVEVVDLSTPEPAYRTSLQTRSGQVKSSNFIDLSQSPVFV